MLMCPLTQLSHLYRYTVLLAVWFSGAACQVVSAVKLLRERNFAKHESLKGRQFVATIIIAMVRAASIAKHLLWCASVGIDQ